MGGARRIEPLAGAVAQGQIKGHVGCLRMVRVADLLVDPVYQREIQAAGKRTIRQICAAFDWSKFLPVIVVETADGFPIVDGQHRATAAATLGIEEVPAYVLACSASEAAAAFVGINATVTRMDQVDIWFAELAAGAEGAAELQRVFDAAEVRIVRRKSEYGPGETSSIKVLRRAAERVGHHVLVTALQCITQTADGYPGIIVGSVVNGIANAIRTKSELLAAPSRLFDIFDGIDLADVLDRARIESATTNNPVQFIVTREINAALAAARDAA